MNKQRSINQHNRFFALVAALYQQWPERHPFQPDSEEHLRAWLLIKADHRIIATFDMTGMTHEAINTIPAIAVAVFRKHIWAWPDGNKLKVAAAKSISIYGKESIGHQEFCKVNDNVEAVIREHVGLDPDLLMRHHAA
jgi:hypothetical protein